MYNYDSFLCYLQSYILRPVIISPFLLSTFSAYFFIPILFTGKSVPTVHIFLFNSLFLSMLPTVSHHPSPCYHLSFPKRDFSAYFLLPFLSDLREKMFLLSSFSCLKLRFLSILPMVLHHPSFYISPFQILTFSVYLRLPFLSDSRAKTFLLSTFSCLQ